MTLIVRTLAILGLGLAAALIHSWVGPEVRLDPDATVTPGRELSPRGTDGQDAGSGQGASRSGNGSASDSQAEPDAGDASGAGNARTDATGGDGSQPESEDNGGEGGGADDGDSGDDDPPAQMDPREFPAEISLEQARFLYQYIESGDVVFIDARGIRERYLEGHIRGAINLDTDDIARGTPAFMEFQDFYPTDAWVVIYCSGGDCDESKHVKIDLADYGYRSTFIFEGGYPAWEQAGLPTATGPDPWGEGE